MFSLHHACRSSQLTLYRAQIETVKHSDSEPGLENSTVYTQAESKDHVNQSILPVS